MTYKSEPYQKKYYIDNNVKGLSQEVIKTFWSRGISENYYVHMEFPLIQYIYISDYETLNCEIRVGFSDDYKIAEIMNNANKKYGFERSETVNNNYYSEVQNRLFISRFAIDEKYTINNVPRDHARSKQVNEWFELQDKSHAVVRINFKNRDLFNFLNMFIRPESFLGEENFIKQLTSQEYDERYIIEEKTQLSIKRIHPDDIDEIISHVTRMNNYTRENIMAYLDWHNAVADIIEQAADDDAERYKDGISVTFLPK